MLWKQPIITSVEGRELVEIPHADKHSLHVLNTISRHKWMPLFCVCQLAGLAVDSQILFTSKYSFKFPYLLKRFFSFTSTPILNFLNLYLFHFACGLSSSGMPRSFDKVKYRSKRAFLRWPSFFFLWLISQFRNTLLCMSWKCKWK